MDPGTGLTVLGAAIGSKELILKVLGPTADYLGLGMKDWAERRFENVRRIFSEASARLGENAPPGAVPPRVLRDVLEDGSFRDDEVAGTYYGGSTRVVAYFGFAR